jgi:uncharacterized membrane protein required for colicin V production
MPIDILFLVALAYGFWQGFRQGIIHTVFNVAAYVFGLTIAFKMTPSMTSILQSIFHSDNPSMFLGAFIVNLLLVVLLMRVMAAGMVKVLSISPHRHCEQGAGGLYDGRILCAGVQYSGVVYGQVPAAE